MNRVKTIVALTLVMVALQGFSQEKPTWTDRPNDPGPGMVRLEGLVKQVVVSDTICSRTYPVTIILEVVKINSAGRSLTNKPSTGQNVTLSVDTVFANKLKNKNTLPSEGSKILVLAKERICQDLHHPVYQLLSLESI